MDRPFGVSLVSIAYWIYGVLPLFFTIIFFSGFLLTSDKSYFFSVLSSSDIIWPLVQGIASIGVGVGLWRLQLWALWGGIALASIYLITNLLEFSVTPTAFGFRYLGLRIMIGSAILLYLILKKSFFTNGHGAFAD